MLGVHSYVQKSGIDLGLLELVKIRVSQINGCAFCLAMHIPLARKNGVLGTCSPGPRHGCFSNRR
jgi:AhpD family alkylhydroperoxidase